MNAGAEEFCRALPLGPRVSGLALDANGLLALSKPSGVRSHPNAPGEEARALLVATYHVEGEYFEWTAAGTGVARRLWLLNRLDSATSGVILAADNEELAITIRAHFKRKQVRKVYVALVFGAPAQPLALWRDFLSIEKRDGKIRTSAREGNIPAESQMRVLRQGRQEPRVSLLRLEPRTGRSHQLRVQCAKRNLPIVGDQTYGDFSGNREFARLAGSKRMFLHSLESSFTYDFKGGTHAFAAKAPLPPEFEKFF